MRLRCAILPHELERTRFEKLFNGRGGYDQRPANPRPRDSRLAAQERVTKAAPEQST